MRPMGSGGVPASAALPRLDHARRHGRRRGALPLPARRSGRDPCYYSYTLLCMPTRPDTLQGSRPLLVLTMLARGGPLHGYAITAHIQRLSDVLRVEKG